jgi:hypothetical protein
MQIHARNTLSPTRLPAAMPELRALAGEHRRRAGVLLVQGLRGVGALSLLAVGAVHLQQYETLYSAIPTIGALFLLNFAGATAIGLGLLAPVERLAGRFGSAALALLALGGIGLAATSIVFLLVSERTPLFGFMEPGYDPTAIAASKGAELATVVLLGSFLLVRFVRRRPAGRW